MVESLIGAAVPAYEQNLPESSVLAELIREARSGNAAAFERIVTLHQRLVLRFAQRLMLNREAARDAAQEVFLRLYRSLQRVDENRDLTPWLYRTTSNICLDALRSRKDHLPLDLIVEPEAEALDPEQEMQATQGQKLLLEALAQLPPKERQAIIMRDLEGWSTSEVAHFLGSSETTIRSQISTGRVKLRQTLAKRMGGRL